jgi:hypothetical protein
MKASKWIHPTTGEVRVYLDGYKNADRQVKAYAIADKDGDAVVIVEGKGQPQKQLDNAKATIRKHFGLYAKFEAYLSVATEPAEKASSHAYGSDYANAYERATGESWGEA